MSIIYLFSNSVLNDLLTEVPEEGDEKKEDTGPMDDISHKTYYITVATQHKLIRFIHDIKIDSLSVGAKKMGDKCVNIDTFLNGFIDIYLEDMDAWKGSYYKLFEQFDDNDNGVLELDEFKKVMEHCTKNNEISNKKVLELFNQIKAFDKSSNDEGVSKEGFIAVLLSNYIYPPDNSPSSRRSSASRKQSKRISISSHRMSTTPEQFQQRKMT